jgi:hypothetical protein
MAEGHGGTRRPSNPAPVSGPGALSQRTDGQGARYMAGGEYGEGQEMMDLQTSAPMSKAPAAPRPRTGRQVVSEEMAPPTPLFAPTQRPDEPVTAGAPFGPGPGPTARTPMSSLAGTLEKLLPYDEDGSIRRLYATAVRRGW